MKRIMLSIAFCLCAGEAVSATLQWDRVADSDMKDYQVYACFIKGCTVAKTAAMLQPGAVLQPAVGVKPSYSIDIDGKEGAVAVVARDLTLNESGLSVQLPFDRLAPGIPLNLLFP